MEWDESTVPPTQRHLRVPDVGTVEGSEGHPVGGLDDRLRLAVQAELAVLAVASPELLARHSEHAAGAVAHEDRVHAGRDEYPARATARWWRVYGGGA